MNGIVTALAISGAQQTAIAARFAKAGWTVRGTSRKPAISPHGPTVVASLESGEGLGEALAGADVALLTLPQDHRAGVMPQVALRVAEAAAQAGVGRLILNVGGTIDEQSELPLFSDLRAARHAIQQSGVPSVILQPTVFMDNLLQLWSLQMIVDHHTFAYPAPAHARISWLSHRSLAEFVFAAATHQAAVGRALRIGGAEGLMANDLCATLSAKLGKPIKYAQIPLDEFAAGIDHAFGAPAGQRIASLYGHLVERPDALLVDATSADLLGVVPESFASFVERQGWDASGSWAI